MRFEGTKDRRLVMRLNSEHADVYERLAAARGMTISAWARATLRVAAFRELKNEAKDSLK